MKKKTTGSRGMTTPVRKEDENVPDYSVIRGLADSDIDEIAGYIQKKSEAIKELKAEIDDLKDAGVKLLVKAGVKTVMVGDLRVTKMDGLSTRLDKDKLFKLGGKKVMDMLVKSTVRTPYTTLLVTPPKKKEEDE